MASAGRKFSFEHARVTGAPSDGGHGSNSEAIFTPKQLENSSEILPKSFPICMQLQTIADNTKG